MEPQAPEEREELSSTLSGHEVFQKFSNFSDTECGEPLVTQKIVIDFTPDDDIDTEFAQRKCCDFWDFVENCPELRGMEVLPEKETYPLASPTTEINSVSSETLTPLPREKTALSVLEFAEEKGLIDRIFEAKLPQSQCTLGSREYHENRSTAVSSESTLNESKSVCKCTTPCKHCNGKKHAPRPVNKTWKKIQEWDKAHPKSFQPPGHQPPLYNGRMQK